MFCGEAVPWYREVTIRGSDATILALANARSKASAIRMIFRYILSTLRRAHVEFNCDRFFRARVNGGKSILQLNRSLISYGSTTIKFTLRIASSAVNGPLFLMVFASNSVSRSATTRETYTGGFPVVRGSRNVVGISYRDRVGFFRRFCGSYFFFEVYRGGFSFYGRCLLLVDGGSRRWMCSLGGGMGTVC